MKYFKFFIISFFLVVNGALAAEIKNYSSSETLKLKSDDFIIGSETAPLTLIEYSSLTCPHCANFHKEIYEELKKKYIDTNQVKYVYRDFPTNHPALLGSMLSHCAGNESYYLYINALMKSQSVWAFHHNFKDSLINVGKLGGISVDKMNSCFTDKTLEDKLIKRAMDAAKEFSIDATPTYFLNGDKYVGVMSLKEWSKIIDKKLKNIKK